MWKRAGDLVIWERNWRHGEGGQLATREGLKGAGRGADR